MMMIMTLNFFVGLPCHVIRDKSLELCTYDTTNTESEHMIAKPMSETHLTQ